MHASLPLDPTTSSHKLKRVLRTQPDLLLEATVLPESVLWQAWVELRKRGEGNGADQLFLKSVKTLHRRRIIGSAELPTEDPFRQEHKLVDDPMLAELWKAYKRCICNQRTGPASQLLRDIEAQLAQG